jgi:hypothetical protein
LLNRALPDHLLTDRAGFHGFQPKTSRSRFRPAFPDSSFADTTTAQFAAQCLKDSARFPAHLTLV